MNKDKIIATHYTYEEDGWYITTSTLDNCIIGDGATPEASFASFLESVEINYREFKAGRHGRYNKVGRPAKGKVGVAYEVAPDVRQAIKDTAKSIGISQGELIEHLLNVYRASNKPA